MNYSMFPIIIIEIEDHEEQGYMKHIFISIVLLFSLTIFAEPVADANVSVNMVPKWNYKTIAMEAAKQRECLARNIYFEARNEPFAGQFAVAMVTLNRVHDKQFPNSICEVVYQGIHWPSGHPKLNRCQFSWYCDGKNDDVKNKRAYKESDKIAFLAIEHCSQIAFLAVLPRTRSSDHRHKLFAKPSPRHALFPHHSP